MLTDPLFYLAAVPAVIVLGLAKGGFAGIGLLGVPLMALAVPPIQAAAIILPILLVQDVFSVWAFRKSWDGRTLALMLPGAALGITAGYALAAFVSVALIELAVGTTAMLFAVLRLRADRVGAPAATAAPVWGVVFGAIAGFTSQIAHAGGPPFQMHVLPKRLARDTFVGTSAIFFAAVNWMKVPAYASLGQLSTTNLAAAAALLPAAIAATFAGVLLVRRIDAERFYRIIYALLIVVGAKLVWDGAATLLR